MDPRLFGATFLAVFLAELGDKTQIAALGLSASSASPWTVFVASTLALAASTAIAVGIGHYASAYLNPTLIRQASGGLFVLMGLWVLFGGQG